ncbi:hypothetical protein ABH926_002575 [Catenulispora sp. GP43]|uniref:hypothetical protein n=1 Tax=Catenulispora sp. GP43 TaxID=3156263 RepID=UPI003517B911
MTDHESDDVRALFQDADLDRVPTSRDLIGPAVAWGNGRRRRDRWTTAGVTGAVAAVALAGVLALRPGGDGGPESVGSGHAATTTQSAAEPAKPNPTAPMTTPAVFQLSGNPPQREQQLLDALKPYLPAGVRISCRGIGQAGMCTTLTITGPTGTSLAQWAPGDYDYRAAPVDAKYNHPHQATAAIPLVSGTVQVPGGTVLVTSTDTEAQDSLSDKTMVTDPTALVFHTAVYEFIPSGTAPAFSMELTEMVRDMPWRPGTEVPDAHALWGFDQNGPVLSPQQFATLATSPLFPTVRQQLADLNLQVMAAPTTASTTAPSTASNTAPNTAPSTSR